MNKPKMPMSLIPKLVYVFVMVLFVFEKISVAWGFIWLGLTLWAIFYPNQPELKYMKDFLIWKFHVLDKGSQPKTEMR